MDPQSYGTCFLQWRSAAGADWAAYVHHPFVTALGDGSLPRSAFLHYLRQDYVFLRHFARAWALAVVKADTLDEMTPAAATVQALVHEEMALHVQLCAAEGITQEALATTEEAPENIAYTRYVLEAGFSGDLCDLLAALAPCVLGYGEIGARVAETAAPETPYRHWIDTYAGREYQALCGTVGALIDNAVVRRLGARPDQNPRWPGLTERFLAATRLEAAFWQMGLRAA